MRINRTPPLSFQEENMDRYLITFTDGSVETVEGTPVIEDEFNTVSFSDNGPVYMLTGIRKWQKIVNYG